MLLCIYIDVVFKRNNYLCVPRNSINKFIFQAFIRSVVYFNHYIFVARVYADFGFKQQKYIQ